MKKFTAKQKEKLINLIHEQISYCEKQQDTFSEDDSYWNELEEEINELLEIKEILSGTVE